MALRGPQPWERVDKDVAKRYEIGKRIGRGCYGIVWEGKRQLHGARKTVAIKKVLSAFRDTNDAQRTYREISYLLEFKDHANIITVRDVLVSPDDRHLYIITDLMESDLQKALQCRAVKPIHRPLIAYQVLCALKYIHSASVMHRDIKPSNILLDSSCKVMLCDFGWARASPEIASLGPPVPMTEYAATRWYRSPEMTLGSRRYTTAVDMWAVGCVVAEIHLDKPLLPGTSMLHMVLLIEEILGKPSAKDIEALEAPYGSLALDTLVAMAPIHSIASLLAHEHDENVVDFLQLLVQYNPEKRMDASDALAHPYVAAFQCLELERAFEGQLELALPDNGRFPAARYRDQIYADVLGLAGAKKRIEDERRARMEAEEELAQMV